MKLLIPLIVAIVLTGCATQQAADPAIMYIAQKPVICISKEQCDLYWQRAQAWVANNSGYKIQTVSDSIIQTYGPMRSRVQLAHQATKTPTGNGTAEITINANCDNIFGCQPDRYFSIARFKTFVLESAPPPYVAPPPVSSPKYGCDLVKSSNGDMELICP